MKLSKKLKRKIYAEAQAIGLGILRLGLREKECLAGFFIHGLTAGDVVRRIMESHDPSSASCLAARTYQRGYQALLDNTDPWARSNNEYVKKHVNRVMTALSARLLNDLLTFYASLACTCVELQKEEQRRKRFERKKKTQPTIILALPITDAEQASA
jgi:hypothetical protein